MLSGRILDAFGRRTLLVCAMVLGAAAGIEAQRTDVSSTERARNAEQVVVGRVSSVTPVWRDTDFGDRRSSRFCMSWSTKH